MYFMIKFAEIYQFFTSIYSLSNSTGASGIKIDPNRAYKKYAANSENTICSQLGVRIMDQGGNAMDSAVAVTICIGIINPFSSGIGGGGFMMIREIKKEKESVEMIDFRETSPANIEIDFFKTHPQSSKVGGMAVAVPGEILGLYEAHIKFGKLPWKRLFEENLIIARGHKASSILIEKLKRNLDYIHNDPGLREIYFKNGKMINENEIIIRNNYAKTLEKLAEDPLSFYKGEIAQKIVKSIELNGGVITLEDLNQYKVKNRKVITTNFKNYKVYTTNLPTSGVLLIQALKILENFDFSKLRQVVDQSNSRFMFHLLIEVYKLVNAKRGELGDPDFIKDPDLLIKNLISNDYIEQIYNKLNMERALDKNECEMSCPFCEDHGTTHLNIVDSNEMIVQVTSTINLEFGAKFMDPETGIIFNNQLDDFYIPEVENSYDLEPMMGNILEKNKRPFSSAAPILMVSTDNIIVLGAAGGTRIPTSIIGTLFYMFLGNNIEQAIFNGRIHNQLSPEITYVENLFSRQLINQLESFGHNVESSEVNTVFTSVQGIHIVVDKENRKSIFAVSDPRKKGRSYGK